MAKTSMPQSINLLAMLNFVIFTDDPVHLYVPNNPRNVVCKLHNTYFWL